MQTVEYTTMLKVALVVALFQIATHSVTSLVVLQNDTLDKKGGSSGTVITLPDDSNRVITQKQSTTDITDGIKGNIYIKFFHKYILTNNSCSCEIHLYFQRNVILRLTISQTFRGGDCVDGRK